ncbi:Dihydroorotate dehydrogenase [compost metagenome]
MIVEASLAHGIDALIVSNTTLERPLTLKSVFAGQAGGLSGAPLKRFAQKALEAAAEAAGGRLPLIAVGGIESGADAWARIRAGASAVQVYSALIYEGPGLVGAIKRDLAARLRAEGFAALSDAVGVGR